MTKAVCPWSYPHIRGRRKETPLVRLRKGHTHCTHGFFMSWGTQSYCDDYLFPVTVQHKKSSSTIWPKMFHHHARINQSINLPVQAIPLLALSPVGLLPPLDILSFITTLNCWLPEDPHSIPLYAVTSTIHSFFLPLQTLKLFCFSTLTISFSISKWVSFLLLF